MYRQSFRRGAEARDEHERIQERIHVARLLPRVTTLVERGLS
jgi:hypothetical protein